MFKYVQNVSNIVRPLQQKKFIQLKQNKLVDSATLSQTDNNLFRELFPDRPFQAKKLFEIKTTKIELPQGQENLNK